MRLSEYEIERIKGLGYDSLSSYLSAMESELIKFLNDRNIILDNVDIYSGCCESTSLRHAEAYEEYFNRSECAYEFDEDEIKDHDWALDADVSLMYCRTRDGDVAIGI